MVYRVSERFKILPSDFDDLNRTTQVRLLAFEQIRQAEEIKELEMMMKSSAMGSVKRGIRG